MGGGKRFGLLLVSIISAAACASPPSDGGPVPNGATQQQRDHAHARWYRDSLPTLARYQKAVADHSRLHPEWRQEGYGNVMAVHLAAAATSDGVRLRFDGLDDDVRFRHPIDAGSGAVRSLAPGFRAHALAQHAQVEYGLASAGVVQRFVWREAADGATELRSSFDVDGLVPILSSTGPGADSRIALRRNGKVALWYRGVYARDAEMRPLRAWATVLGGTITVHVDATAATFPVVADPLVTSNTQTLRLPGALPDHRFGTWVRLFGDQLVVGCPDDFHRYRALADGTWQLEQTVTLPTGRPINHSPERLAFRENNGDVTVWEPDAATDDYELSATISLPFAQANAPVASGNRVAFVSATDQHIYERQPDASWIQIAQWPRIGFFQSNYVAPYLMVRNSNFEGVLVTVDGAGQPAAQQVVPTDGVGAIATDGQHLVVHDSYNATNGIESGALLAYEKQPDGSFTFVDYLYATNAHSLGYFGRQPDMTDGFLVAGGPGGFTWGGVYAFRYSNSEGKFVDGIPLAPLDGADANADVRSGKLGRRGLVAVPHALNSVMANRAGAVHFYQLTRVNGDPCASAEECASGMCVDGVCCDTGCDNGCQRCDVAGLEGTCSDVVAGSDPGDACNPGACNGSGICAADGGASCTTPSECASNVCSGGTCCDRPCDEACETCLMDGAEGTCTPRSMGQEVPECGAFACDGQNNFCPDRCDTDATCAGTAWCNALGLCESQSELGGPCAADLACGSGFCTGGQCCSERCDSPCAVCAGGICNVDPCGDYVCQNNSCRTSCDSTVECAPGRQCNADGECVVVSGPDSLTSSGCTVSTPRQRTGSSWWGRLGLTALAFLAVRRHRQTRGLS